ncbi:MAG TPA: FHA domain-containing protein [Micromonosporaceae bacterium]|jgi:hypothetical protein|nr:FHA domain-containing protein [Micromonosporaceae bacterium]
MRFEVSRVLDAIELRLTTDPAVARGVVDLAEVLRYADLDGGRAASLLRLGQVVDALARLLADQSATVYTVVDRSVLSDGDLTSNERMVIRRWADDGLVEVVQAAGDRVFEVADLTGLPVLSRRDPGRLAEAYPWLINDLGRLLKPVAGGGGTMLVGAAGVATSGASTHPFLSRLWQCPETGCELFGPDRMAGQPPPRIRAGVPTCPRHEHRLADGGPRPASVTLAVRIGGVVRHRFAVTAGTAVTVGREPTEAPAVRLGVWLPEDARMMVSRNHLVVTLGPAGVEVRDSSTNGTVVRTPAGPDGSTEEVRLSRGDSHVLGDRDVVEVYDDVELARPGRWRTGGMVEARSVMADAPTVAMRMPNG